MNSTARLFSASLITMGALLAQGPPPGGPGGHGGPGGGPGFMGPPVTGAPFSAIKTDTHQQSLADGNQIQETRTERIYRDTDGRTRTESTMTTPSGTTRTMITIFDPVSGFVAHLNPADSTAVKQTLPTPPSGTPKARPTPPTDAQVVKADLGSQTIAGVAATGTSTTHTIPAGKMGNTEPIVETREVWMSTALQIPVKETSTSPVHGTSSMVMSNITQGPQDPTLFQIPSSYTVKDAPAGHAHGGPPPPPPPTGGSL